MKAPISIRARSHLMIPIMLSVYVLVLCFGMIKWEEAESAARAPACTHPMDVSQYKSRAGGTTKKKNRVKLHFANRPLHGYQPIPMDSPPDQDWKAYAEISSNASVVTSEYSYGNLLEEHLRTQQVPDVLLIVRSRALQSRVPLERLLQKAYTNVWGVHLDILYVDDDVINGSNPERLAAAVQQYQQTLQQQPHEPSLSRNKIFQPASMVNSNRSGMSSQTAKKICFVSSSFGTAANQVDRIPNITETDSTIWRENGSKVQFFVFTNLVDLESPGWQHLYYPRDTERFPNHIVASRFGKFMGWKVPELAQNCRSVFYVDGGWLPAKTIKYWEWLTDSLLQADGGLVQYAHMWSSSLGDELKTILKHLKDSEQHVAEELAWLQNQPDYVDKMPMVCNMAFGYDPSNPRYQKLSTSFWMHYHGSDLGSWRDQPSWNFFLHKSRITPLHFGNWPHDLAIWNFVKTTGRNSSWIRRGEKGFKHQYVGRGAARRQKRQAASNNQNI